MASTVSRTSSDRPLTAQEIINAARAFQGSETWVVDNYNCLAALLALADDRQPSELYLIARDDAEEDMPIEVIEEISRRAKSCRISMRFVDSFLKPCSTTTDRRRLELLLPNKSFKYDRFYGYVDAEVAQQALPSFSSLGLAIKNAVDAALVSSLRLDTLNAKLRHLNISVSTEVAVQELQPLDASFHDTVVYLTFPYLTDEYVNNVRPAIDALIRDRRVAGLFFPKSRVTAAGARRLASQLYGAVVPKIGIEPCETWKQEHKEMESVQEMLIRVVGIGNVEWNVDWLYKKSQMIPGEEVPPLWPTQ